MSTKGESKQHVPSVIARLMGLDELPSQQPVQKKPRVLSENYLRRVASIGVREKFSERHSFRLGTKEQDECRNVLQVLETLRRNKRHVSGDKKFNEMTDVYLRSGHVSEFESPCASNCNDISMCRTFRRKNEIESPTQDQNGPGIYLSGEHCINNMNNSCRSKLKLNYSSRLTNRVVHLQSNLGKVDSAARCFSLSPQSHDASHSSDGKKTKIHIGNLCGEMTERKNMSNNIAPVRPRSRFLRTRVKNAGPYTELSSEICGNEPVVKEAKSKIPSSPIFPDRKSQFYCSDGSYVAGEAKKRISKRWKTSRKFQQVELATISKTLGEMLATPDRPPKCILNNQGSSDIGYGNFNTLLGISKFSWKHESVRDLPRSRSFLAHFNAVGSSMRNLKSNNLVQNKSSDKDLNQKDGAEHRSDDFSCRNSQPIHHVELESDVPLGDDVSRIQDTSVQQEISNEISEEESVSSQYYGTDPESLISAEEAYQPSPDSVLEPLYNKDISPISDCFKSVNSSLHGLHMQLELLKSETFETYSDVSSMMVSSDEDSREGSVNGHEGNEELMRSFRIEESRDFSYLVDVVAEAGLHNVNLHSDLDAWHSQECLISYSVFETLEKKYGEQISWKRSERKLLFDRINSGLVEILQPSTGMQIWTKPVSRRLSFSQGDEMIEEELWMFLTNQEKELSKESEKFLGKDDGWLELENDIQIIGGEIENSLIDELLADISMESL